MAITILTDYDRGALEDFRSLKGKGGHFERSLFIAEGPKVSRKMIASRFEIPSAYMTPDHLEALRPALEARSDTTTVYLDDHAEMERVIGYPLHQGLMLAVRIPPTPELAQAAATWPDDATVIALDSIADAENMGAIIRSAAAFGVSAILLDGRSCNPFLRRSVRVSMGTIADVPLVSVPDLARALAELRLLRTNTHIIGAALGPTSRPIDEVARRDGTCVLVFGSEGWGLRPDVASACEDLVEIPISPSVDSLNVAIATGIFLYRYGHRSATLR